MVSHSTYRANLWLLYIHNIQTLFRYGALVDILVSGLLSAKIGIIVAQGVQDLAECFVEALAGRIHACSLLLMLIVLVCVVLSIVLLNYMR